MNSVFQFMNYQIWRNNFIAHLSFRHQQYFDKKKVKHETKYSKNAFIVNTNKIVLNIIRIIKFILTIVSYSTTHLDKK